MSYETAVELTERWGYALELAGYATREMVDDIYSNSTGRNARLVALSQSNPTKYPLSVLAYRPLAGGAPTLPDHLLKLYHVRDSADNYIMDPAVGGTSFRTVSPEAPDSIYEWAGQVQAGPLGRLGLTVPLSIILSGGEYGVSAAGHSQTFWQQDPRVVAAKGGRSWYDYISERKSRYELIVTNATRGLVPNRGLYIYYHTGGIPTRNAFADWADWGYDYSYMKPVSDIANSAYYYNKANTGWSGTRDMLTCFLNCAGQQIKAGSTLSYNWLNAGHEGVTPPELPRYMGFLKCCYTAGMIGGVAAYNSFPAGGFDADMETPPVWLQQLQALSHVHASFSHLENFLRQGQLLLGTSLHRWSTDQPSYEIFVDSTTRVVSRKLGSQWLVTVWAASGPDRTVIFKVPGSAKISAIARASGAMYLLTKQGTKTIKRLLDPDGMVPSAGF